MKKIFCWQNILFFFVWGIGGMFVLSPICAFIVYIGLMLTHFILSHTLSIAFEMYCLSGRFEFYIDYAYKEFLITLYLLGFVIGFQLISYFKNRKRLSHVDELMQLKNQIIYKKSDSDI